MEHVICNYCNSSAYRQIYKINKWMVVKCKSCGLVFLNPRPSTEEFDGLYSESYYSGHLTNQYPSDQLSIEKGIDSMKFLLDIVTPHIKKGRILEIGCATGLFLAYASRYGFEVCGIEISEYASKYAREHLRLDVKTGVVEDIHLFWPDCYFDVIMMSHVVEHFPDPLTTLSLTNRLLKPGGLLIIRTPDFSSFDAKYYREKWSGLSIPFHLYFFTPKSLCKMLKKTGYKIKEINYWLSPTIINPILKLIKKCNPSWNVGLDSTTPTDSQLSNKHSNKQSMSRILLKMGYNIFKRSIGRLFKGRTMTIIVEKVL